MGCTSVPAQTAQGNGFHGSNHHPIISNCAGPDPRLLDLNFLLRLYTLPYHCKISAKSPSPKKRFVLGHVKWDT